MSVTASVGDQFINASDFDSREDWERARHKFCGECGRAMVEVTAPMGFCTVTGTPMSSLRLRCPSFDEPLGAYHDDVYLRTIR